MKKMKSKFILCGYKNDTKYYIVKTFKGYNIYQEVEDLSEHMSSQDIKDFMPAFKDLDDDEVIMLTPDGVQSAFLLMHGANLNQMNLFRLTLAHEERIA